MLSWSWISVLVIVLDQMTKIIASSVLTLHQPVAVLPVFNFTLMHNNGAAFSFLHNAGGWQRWFFTVIAIGVSGLIIYWLTKMTKQERWQAIAFCLILGGAIGNVIDRIYLGYVVDFIEVYYTTHFFPAFNIADSAISIGGAILVLDIIRSYRKGHAAHG